MFKKLTVLTLLAITFLTVERLQAHDNGWAAFGVGLGVGIVGTEIYEANRPRECCYPPAVYYQPTPGYVVYSEPPPVVVQPVVYRNNYDYIGSSIISQVSSTPNARTLTLDNGMIFEIAAGTYNWTGYNVTIYRDAYAGTTGNYILVIKGQQYRANKLATGPIPAPIPAPRPS